MPSDWRIEARPGTGGLHPGEPGIETFTGDNRLLGIAVVAVEDGQLLGTWRSPIGLHYEESDAEGHGVPALETRRTTVDGVEARITRYRLDLTPYTNDIMEVELIADGRGWMLTFLLLDGISDADEELLDEILASLRLPG